MAGLNGSLWQWVARGLVTLLLSILGVLIGVHQARVSRLEGDLRVVQAAQVSAVGTVATVQATLDETVARLDRIEAKLDRLIERSR